MGDFFSGAFLSALIFGIFIRLFSGRIAYYIVELGGDQDILEPDSRPNYFSDRRLVRRQWGGSLFFLGMVLIFLAALTLASLPVLWHSAPQIEAKSIYVILYILLALVLLSQRQFSVMRGRWGWQRSPIAGEIAQFWLTYSVIFLMIVLILIVLLPTGYSLNLFETFAIFFQFLWRIISTLMYLWLLPVLLLLRLFSRSEDPVQQDVESVSEIDPLQFLPA